MEELFLGFPAIVDGKRLQWRGENGADNREELLGFGCYGLFFSLW